MPNTPIHNIPYPANGEHPFAQTMAAMALAIDGLIGTGGGGGGTGQGYGSDAIVIVQPGETAIDSGINFVAAYLAASELTPGGLPLSYNNRALLMVPAGIYELTEGFQLESEYVDIAGQGESIDNFAESNSWTALDYSMQSALTIIKGNITDAPLITQSIDGVQISKIVFANTAIVSENVCYLIENPGYATYFNSCSFSTIGYSFVTNAEYVCAAFLNCRADAYFISALSGPVDFFGIAEFCCAKDNSFGCSIDSIGSFDGKARFCRAGNNSFGTTLATNYDMASVFNGEAINCRAGNYSFGSSMNTAFAQIGIAAVAINCEAGHNSFGHANILEYTNKKYATLQMLGGKFENCKAGHHSFGTATGPGCAIQFRGTTFKNCQAGEDSFGTVQNTYGGDISFAPDGLNQGITYTKFIDCNAGQRSFINARQIINTVDNGILFLRCNQLPVETSFDQTNLPFSFICSNESGGVIDVNNIVIEVCHGGGYCFGYAQGTVSISHGIFTGVRGLNNCFSSSPLWGKLIDCKFQDCRAFESSFAPPAQIEAPGPSIELCDFLNCQWGNWSGFSLTSSSFKNCKFETGSISQITLCTFTDCDLGPQFAKTVYLSMPAFIDTGSKFLNCKSLARLDSIERPAGFFKDCIFTMQPGAQVPLILIDDIVQQPVIMSSVLLTAPGQELITSFSGYICLANSQINELLSNLFQNIAGDLTTAQNVYSPYFAYSGLALGGGGA